MKLKLFLKAFDVLHKDLKAIYNILLCVYLIDGEKREDKICFNEASYALLIYFVNKEERTLDYIKEVIGI